MGSITRNFANNILTDGKFDATDVVGNITSTGIDDNATSTAITIDSSENVDIVGTTTSSNFIVDGTGYAIKMYFNGTATLNNNSNAVIFTGAGASGDYPAGTLNLQSRGDGTARDINLITGATPSNTLTAHGNGDISFYEDTGATPKMFWDASAESLGIGTSSPSSKLSIYSSDTTVYSASSVGGQDSGSTLKIQNNSNAADVFASIDFNTNNNRVVNRIVSSHGNSTVDGFLSFITEGGGTPAERMRINSSGNVGIGTSTPTEALEVKGRIILDGDGSGTNNGTLIIDGSATSSSQIRFSQDGTPKGYVTYWDSFDTLGLTDGSGNGLHFSPSTQRVGIGTSSPSQALDVVGSIEVSDGIYIGGTAAANKLDDYEEGTWTPTYVASTTDFTSVTYQQQNGKYTKIGDTVSLTVTLSTNAITKGSASGEVYIAGLPFTPNSNYSNGTILYNTANWLGDIPDGWTTFGTTRGYLFYKSSTTAVSSINPADMGTGGSANNFIATMIYKTDA